VVTRDDGAEEGSEGQEGRAEQEAREERIYRAACDLLFLSVVEAKRRKLEEGALEHGVPVGSRFKYSPLVSSHDEVVDLLNYTDEALEQRLISPALHFYLTATLEGLLRLFRDLLLDRCRVCGFSRDRHRAARLCTDNVLSHDFDPHVGPELTG
jgi:hypothetical protein